MIAKNSNSHHGCNSTATDSYLSTEGQAFEPSQALIRLVHRGADPQEVATEYPTMEFPDEEEIRANSIGGKNISWDGPTVAAWGIPHPYPKGWMEALRAKDESFFVQRGIFIHRRRKPIPWEEDGLFVWG
jgi:hypothetical protein